MNQKYFKKLMALLISFAMMFTLLTGFVSSGKPLASKLKFPLAKKITIEFILGEHPTQGKYQWADDGQPGFKWLEQQTNIHIKVTHIPQGNLKDKMSLMISTNQLPDLTMSTWTLNEVESAGDKGLFVNILDPKYKGYLPNYMKLIDTMPALKNYVHDGKMYGFYQVDPNAAAFTMTIPYRKDLWDKYKLKSDTWDELYQSMKILKKNYPKSYPFGTFAQGGAVTLLGMGAPTFKTSDSIYYNLDKKAWVYGPSEDNYKRFLQYFAKLYKEKLLNPEAATMTYEAWSSSWVKSETFIGFWWSATGNWFSPDTTAKNPNYGRDKEWTEAMRIPAMKAGGPRGWTSVNAPSPVYSPKLISTKSKYIKEIIALMDFVSTIDNVAKMTYGPSGKIWDKVDGKYRWVAKEIKVPYNPSGTMTYSDYYKEKFGLRMVSENNFSIDNDSLISYELNDAMADPDYKQFLDECDMYVKDGSTLTIPQPITRFSAEDSEQVTQLKTALDTYANEISIKIITGQKPLSEFTNMKKNLQSMGADKLIAFYKKASGK